MSNNYFMGDLHFGHNGISEKFRTQFGSDEDHHEAIHSNVMDCAGKRNNLYLLGDVFFKQEHFTKLDDYAKNFDQVWLFLGNHDAKSIVRYAMGFPNVNCFGLYKRFGYWLSHAPIHPQELYRGYSIHGHVHTNTVPDARYLNVSCENVNYKPIELDEIRAIFEQRVRMGLIADVKPHKD